MTHDFSVQIHLDDDRRVYAPGDTLAGSFRVESWVAVPLEAVEVSVLWYTEGLGDEDMAVHYFERRSRDQGDVVDLRKPQPFQTRLPVSPLSYEGRIIKLRWCVRVRIFPMEGRDLVTEEPIQLGSVPPARVAVAAEAVSVS